MSRLPCTPSAQGESDNAGPKYSGQYFKESHYFVGIDETKTFREKIQEIYGDNHEITDAVSQLDEYFSDLADLGAGKGSPGTDERIFADVSNVADSVMENVRAVSWDPRPRYGGGPDSGSHRAHFCSNPRYCRSHFTRRNLKRQRIWLTKANPTIFLLKFGFVLL